MRRPSPLLSKSSKRPRGAKAFAVFTVTVMVALSAAAAVLLPDQAAEATDLGIVQIDQLFGSGTFEP